MQIHTILGNICGLALLAGVGFVEGASLSNADKQFMIEAAKADMTEAHEGQMAEEQANRADVKAFAKTLVQDHTESYGQLTGLAAKVGVSIPKGINTAQDRTIRQLVHLKGAGFDREFSRDEIAAHRHAIAVFKHEAEHGQDADIKAYAAKMIPVLEKHLHLAEECAKTATHG
jgi:putative membrane protein